MSYDTVMQQWNDWCVSLTNKVITLTASSPAPQAAASARPVLSSLARLHFSSPHSPSPARTPPRTLRTTWGTRGPSSPHPDYDSHPPHALTSRSPHPPSSPHDAGTRTLPHESPLASPSPSRTAPSPSPPSPPPHAIHPPRPRRPTHPSSTNGGCDAASLPSLLSLLILPSRRIVACGMCEWSQRNVACGRSVWSQRIVVCVRSV